jgi:hypothetical protein
LLLQQIVYVRYCLDAFRRAVGARVGFGQHRSPVAIGIDDQWPQQGPDFSSIERLTDLLGWTANVLAKQREGWFYRCLARPRMPGTKHIRGHVVGDRYPGDDEIGALVREVVF